jgi:hypothetical protein
LPTLVIAYAVKRSQATSAQEFTPNAGGLGLLIIFSPLLFWLVSVLQISTVLAPEQAAQAQRMADGWHPFAIDFRRPESLAKQPGTGARFVWQDATLRVSTEATGFDLRINMQGGVLPLTQLSTLHFAVKANSDQARALRWWWVVYDQADQPGWIAPLMGATDHIDVSALRFANEQDRAQVKLASELAPVRYMRLYGEAPIGADFTLEQLRFRPSALANNRAEQSAAWIPEAMLSAVDRARSKAQPMPQFSPIEFSPIEFTTPIWQAWPNAIKRIVDAFWLLSLLVLASLMLRAPENSVLRSRYAAALAIALGLSFALLLSQIPIAGWSAYSWRWRLAVLLLVAVLFSLWREHGSGQVATKNSQGSISAQANPIAVLIATLALIAMLWLAFGLPTRLPHGTRLLVYVGLVALQQLLLQRMLLEKLLAVFPARWAIVISALLFALWHTPNFSLMCLSFFAALLWCSWYHQGQRLSLIVASHVVLGWVAVATIPSDVLRNAQVGYSYLEQGQSTR